MVIILSVVVSLIWCVSDLKDLYNLKQLVATSLSHALHVEGITQVYTYYSSSLFLGSINSFVNDIRVHEVLINVLREI